MKTCKICNKRIRLWQSWKKLMPTDTEPEEYIHVKCFDKLDNYSTRNDIQQIKAQKEDRTLSSPSSGDTKTLGNRVQPERSPSKELDNQSTADNSNEIKITYMEEA
jgi:hypothetical protein